MNDETRDKLHQFGFRLGKNGNSDFESWSQIFQVGNMRAVLCIREFGIGHQYRFLLANVGKEREQEQWSDASDIISAIWALRAALSMWLKVRRELEGSLVPRSWRRLVGRWLSESQGQRTVG